MKKDMKETVGRRMQPLCDQLMSYLVMHVQLEISQNASKRFTSYSKAVKVLKQTASLQMPRSNLNGEHSMKEGEKSS